MIELKLNIRELCVCLYDKIHIPLRLLKLEWKSRISEVLNKKKRLTVDMIRELEQVLQISASVLVSNYKLAKK